MDADEPPGRWEPLVEGLRFALGWAAIAIGVLDMITELDRTGPPDGPYLLFHVTLMTAGVVLLAVRWLAPRPGRAGYGTGVAVLAGGMLIGAIPATTICCMSEYATRHGFPFTFLARDPAGGWHAEPLAAGADLAFWAFLGFLLIVIVGLLRPGRIAPDSRRHYIEHPAGRDAERKAVGPLP